MLSADSDMEIGERTGCDNLLIEICSPKYQLFLLRIAKEEKYQYGVEKKVGNLSFCWISVIKRSSSMIGILVYQPSGL